MAESFPTLLAGQRITASLMNSMLPQVARKTSDTNRAATTTQTIDPHLQFTVVANAVYAFQGWLSCDAATAGDMIIGFSNPTGCLGTWMAMGVGTSVVSGTSGAGTQTDSASTWGYTVRTEATTIDNTRTYGALGVGQPLTITFGGMLRVGSTGGTWGLKWSQSVSNATATTIYTDSWLMLQRIA